MGSRFWLTLFSLFAFISFAAPAMAQRPEPGTVRIRRVERSGERDVLHVTVGARVGVRRLIDLANRSLLESAARVTAEDLIRENPGRLIFVCRRAPGIARSFSRRPEHWLACASDRHELWLVNGLTYRVPRRHEPTAEERLVIAEREQARLRAERDRLVRDRERERADQSARLAALEHRVERHETVQRGVRHELNQSRLALERHRVRSRYDRWIAGLLIILVILAVTLIAILFGRRRVRMIIEELSAIYGEAIRRKDQELDAAGEGARRLAAKAAEWEKLEKSVERNLAAAVKMIQRLRTKVLPRALRLLAHRKDGQIAELTNKLRKEQERRERIRVNRGLLASLDLHLAQAQTHLRDVTLLRDQAEKSAIKPLECIVYTDQVRRAQEEVDALRHEREQTLSPLEDDLRVATGLDCHPSDYLADLDKRDKELRDAQERADKLAAAVADFERRNQGLEAALNRSARLYANAVGDGHAKDEQIMQLKLQSEVIDLLAQDSRIVRFEQPAKPLVETPWSKLSNIPPSDAPAPAHTVLDPREHAVLHLGIAMSRLLDRLETVAPHTVVVFDRIAYFEAINLCAVPVQCLTCRDQGKPNVAIGFGYLPAHYRRRHAGIPPRLRSRTLSPPGL